MRQYVVAGDDGEKLYQSINLELPFRRSSWTDWRNKKNPFL
jgi:hypothetical protein